MTINNEQLIGLTKTTPQSTSQSQTGTKKGQGHCLGVCCPSDPLKLYEPWWNLYNEMHQKLQCLPLAVVNRKGPVLHDNTWLHIEQPVLQRLNELGYKVLPHPWYSPDLLLTNYHLFKHLDNISQGKCFPNQQDAENALQELTESQNTDFYVQE